MIEATWSDIFKILLLLFGFGIALKLILGAIFGGSNEEEEKKKMSEKIIKIRLRDGSLEILEKTGENSYDALHVGVVNGVCYERLKELFGGKIKEFIIK